jgi:hypothetical protein
MKNKINRVCIIDSAYSLFLYFLISTEQEIDSTFYFVSDGIPKEVRCNLKHKHYFDYKSYKGANGLIKRIMLFLLRYFSIIRWTFLRNSELYGHDHLFFSPGLVGKKKMTVIEDGTSNYISYSKQYKIKYPCLQRLLFGSLVSSSRFGNNSCCKQLILTGIKQIDFMDFMFKNNIRIISIDKLWQESSLKKQEKILSIFSLTVEDINFLQTKESILFTQCFSEDDIMTENDKIDIYKEMIKDIDKGKLVIKPHPRETTDYTIHFPDHHVFTKRIPMELLDIVGIRFKKSYTVCSTAALSFSYEIEHVFLGTEINPKIVEVYGVIRLSDFNK